MPSSTSASLPASRPSRVVVEAVAPARRRRRLPGQGDGRRAGHGARRRVHRRPRPRRRRAALPASAARRWREIPMEPLGNDRFRATFVPDQLGRWQYQVVGWLDHLGTWRHGMELKLAAGVDVAVDLQIGVGLIDAAAGRGPSGADAAALDDAARPPRRRRHPRRSGCLPSEDEPRHGDGHIPDLDDVEPERPTTASTSTRCSGAPACRQPVAELARPLDLEVDRERARFSAWYEFFPRSTLAPADRPRHARSTPSTASTTSPRWASTCSTCRRSTRSARPSARAATTRTTPTRRRHRQPVGDRRARGRAHGRPPRARHRRRRRQAAPRPAATAASSWPSTSRSSARPTTRGSPSTRRGSPTAPTARSSTPRTRPRSTRTSTRSTSRAPTGRACGPALADVIRFWIDAGVTIFRVDNPHTKAFAVLGVGDRRRSGASTPRRSSWPRRSPGRGSWSGWPRSASTSRTRTSRGASRGGSCGTYFEDLATRTVDYFRPNAWPNTPDILTEQLQTGGPAMFAIRAILAATLSPAWGVYGPAFELMEHLPVRPGSEEYLDSEKYQLRQWDLHRPDSLAPLLGRLNRIRREQPALAHLRTLTFHNTDNDGPAVLLEDRPGRRRPAGPRRRQPRRPPTPAGLRRRRPEAARPALRLGLRRRRPAHRRLATAGTGRGTSSSSTRRPPAHIFRVDPA